MFRGAKRERERWKRARDLFFLSGHAKRNALHRERESRLGVFFLFSQTAKRNQKKLESHFSPKKSLTMKLSFARKEDAILTASSSSSSSPSSSPVGVLAIGLCDIAGAGVRALQALESSLVVGEKRSSALLEKRQFELKFTNDKGGDLIGKNGGSDDDGEEEEDAAREEDEDDISALERAIFVKTSDDGDFSSFAPTASLVQFTDPNANNAVVLSCLVINVMVPEIDEASVCYAVVRFVREHLESCVEKIVFCAALKLERGVVKGDPEKDMFCFGNEVFKNEKLTRLDEKSTIVRDGLLKGLISGCRCAFGSENVSGLIVPGFAVPRVGGSEMEIESGETANRLEKVVAESFKCIGISASGNANNFRATKTWWKTIEGAKFMSSMFM